MNRLSAPALAVLAAAFSASLPVASAADAPSFAPPPGVQVSEEGPRKLKFYKIPNIPKAAEAYYGTDNLHIIAQVQDPDAVRAKPTDGGALTWTFTDQGTDLTRINGNGNDACSYFFPDMKHVVWTSVRDHLDVPLGNWSDPRDYPQGGELYKSDLKGGNVQRLTNNKYYDAEISVSPNGKWIVFGRQTDGNMDLWRMKADGTGEEQITFTKDWDEGRPMYLPDSETVMFRAWKYEDYGKIRPTPMTVFTIKHDGTGTHAAHASEYRHELEQLSGARRAPLHRRTGHREQQLGDLPVTTWRTSMPSPSGSRTTTASTASIRSRRTARRCCSRARRARAS